MKEKRSLHPKRPAEIFQLFATTTSLSGVGAKLALILEKRIGHYVIDVLRHLPIGLIDRSQRPPLNNVTDGSIATFDVVVVKHDRPPRGVRRPYRVFCENETGILELVFFHAHEKKLVLVCLFHFRKTPGKAAGRHGGDGHV